MNFSELYEEDEYFSADNKYENINSTLEESNNFKEMCQTKEIEEISDDELYNHLSEEDIKNLKINTYLDESIIEYEINEIVYNLYLVTNPNYIKNIFQNINDYTFNNNLDVKHIENLKKNYNNSSILINTFICIKTTDDGKYHLIDGHHRKKTILENDLGKYPKQIMFLIYEFNNLSNDNIEFLFDEINNTKPYSRDIVIHSRNITKKVVDHFEKNPNKKIKTKIFSDANKRASRWKIHIKTFNSQLQFELTKLKGSIDEEKIFQKILEINKRLKSRYASIISKFVFANEMEKRKKYIKDCDCFLICQKPDEYLYKIHE